MNTLEFILKVTKRMHLTFLPDDALKGTIKAYFHEHNTCSRLRLCD